MTITTAGNPLPVTFSKNEMMKHLCKPYFGGFQCSDYVSNRYSSKEAAALMDVSLSFSQQDVLTFHKFTKNNNAK